MRYGVCVVLLALTFPAVGDVNDAADGRVAAEASELTGRATLGRQIFFDTNLSKNRTQSCATCHNPARGFIDARDNGIGGAVSMGDDGISLGYRNAPTAAYAFLSPRFHKNKIGEYVGGQFHDGREATLAGQAGQPFLGSLEMGMPSKASVVERISENPDYVTQFKALFGQSVFAETERVYGAITESLAAFEQTELFAPFDSKYDRYLRGEYSFSNEEALGHNLFFSRMTNCSSCHVLDSSSYDHRETFTNYGYYNIGVPANVEVREMNGRGIADKDLGLLQHPQVTDPALAGKFKVPTLRNVAVTGPYMHNGVFGELRTAVLFYSRYNIRNNDNQINPETGRPWSEPEVGETVNLALLRQGVPLHDRYVDYLVAFLKTLTDKRYELLLNDSSM